jgi:hypothetical protein
MFCGQCRTPLPDDAKFCYKCGAALPGGAGGDPPPPPPAPPPTSSTAPSTTGVGVESLKCPQCGAPLHPVFGEMVISCEYCSASVSLGGSGWKAISKHTILVPKVLTPEEALGIVHQWMDTGFLHRKAFEESKIVEQKLSFIPFWVFPASATTNFVYTDMAVSVGSTVGSIAAVEVLGNALGGNRGGGGFIGIPVMMGSPVNSSRQDTIVGQYEYPVVAVKGMTAYQPKNYEFALRDRTFFDKRGIPNGAAVLNGDLGEDAAQFSAKSYVTQLQTELAHKKHYMVSQLNCQVQVSEGELMHVPIWYFIFDRKGQKSIVLVDAHSGKVMQTVV